MTVWQTGLACSFSGPLVHSGLLCYTVVREFVVAGFSGVNKDSNILQWFDYFGCNGVRSFFTFSQPGDPPGGDWRARMGDSFGKDVISGLPVTTKDGYMLAVQSMRQKARQVDFLDWLVSGSSPRSQNWADYLKRYNAEGPKEFFFKSINERGQHVIGLWDFRCRSLKMESFLDDQPEYWMERWEETLLYYVGGHVSSKWNIDEMEVYNEPDLDLKKYGCIDVNRYKDLLRIRSQAVRAGYADRGSGVSIHVGSFTRGWDPVLSKVISQNLWEPFPDPDFWAKYEKEMGENTRQDDDDASDYSEDAYEAPYEAPNPDTVGFGDSRWAIGDFYALHDYGSFSAKSCTEFASDCRHENGYSVAKNANKAISRLREWNATSQMKVSITEFNAYTAGGSDKTGHEYFQGKNVVDKGATSSSLASQFSGFFKQGANRNYHIVIVHKFMQTPHSSMPSGVAKNGLTYGNFGEYQGIPHGDELVKSIGGISRTGMALRQMCTKAGFANDVYDLNNWNGKSVNNKLSRFNIWTVKQNELAHIFAINDNWVSTSAEVKVDPLINHPNQPYWVAEISDSAFSEVTQRGGTGDDRKLYLDIPKSTVKIVSIPTVPARWETVEAFQDAAIGVKNYGPGDAKSMRVATDGKDSSIVMVNFDKGDRAVVGAIMELTLERSTNDDPQVLTVVAWNRGWDEGYQPWNRLPFLKNDIGDTSRIEGNFLNWDQVEIVGHLTVPPNARSGQKVSLDVSEWIGRVGNFAVMRLVRHDASPNAGPSQTPADIIQGEYFFHSKEAVNPDDRPKLHMAVRA